MKRANTVPRPPALTPAVGAAQCRRPCGAAWRRKRALEGNPRPAPKRNVVVLAGHAAQAILVANAANNVNVCPVRVAVTFSVTHRLRTGGPQSPRTTPAFVAVWVGGMGTPPTGRITKSSTSRKHCPGDGLCLSGSPQSVAGDFGGSREANDSSCKSPLRAASGQWPRDGPPAAARARNDGPGRPQNFAAASSMAARSARRRRASEAPGKARQRPPAASERRGIFRHMTVTARMPARGTVQATTFVWALFCAHIQRVAVVT